MTTDSSTSMEQVIGALGEAFENQNGGVAFTYNPTGSGSGIQAKYQGRVFERFFRVDKSRSKASSGTGLGLSIVKHIAQYHHAAVTPYSRPGEGTSITVTFP